MIADYLYTIGKYLAPSQRDEVLKEIEANLYDYLEENFGEKAYSEAEIEAAVKAMGHPKKVAEAYLNSPRVLIGPAYIDTYWLVLKIALVGLTIGLSVATALSASEAKDGIALVFQLVGQLWQSGLAAVGMVTLIFAAIHYYSPQETPEKDEAWSVKILEKAPEPDERIKIFDIVLETFFICVGLVIINTVSLQTSLRTSDSVIIPMMNMAYAGTFVIQFQLLMGASLLLNLYLLIKRKWQVLTRFISILLDVLSIALLAVLAYTPEIWDLSKIAGALGTDKAIIGQWFQVSLQATLAIFVIVIAFEIYGHMKALWKAKRV